MTIPITPNSVTISADTAETSTALVRVLISYLVDMAITVDTCHHGCHTLTVLEHQPHHDPTCLYGAAFLERGEPEPPVGLPIIPIDDIVAIHVY